MRLFARLVPLVAALAAGCSSQATTPRVGPHGGEAIPLPGGSGFGEVVVESSGPPPKGAPAKAAGARVVAYFFGPDLTTPLDPPPTSVRVTVPRPDRSTATLDLARAPKADDPAGKARFASEAGPFDQLDQVFGDLTATAGGREFTARFSNR